PPLILLSNQKDAIAAQVLVDRDPDRNERLLEISGRAEIHHRQTAGGVLELERLPLLGHEFGPHEAIVAPLRPGFLQRGAQDLPVINVADVERRLWRVINVGHRPRRAGEPGRERGQDYDESRNREDAQNDLSGGPWR